jgi:hypothetical protein
MCSFYYEWNHQGYTLEDLETVPRAKFCLDIVIVHGPQSFDAGMYSENAY